MSHRVTDSVRFGARGRLSMLGPALLIVGVVGAGCSSSTATPADGGVGVVTGEADNHCSGVEPIVVSQASCHPAADAGAPPESDAGEPEPAVHFNGASDDDDCKYHVAFTSTPVVKNQNVTFNVTLTKLADNAPATGGDVTIESFLLDNELHPIPNNGTKTTESPAGSGKYTVTPVKFDASGRWVVRFHFFETCEDILEDSPHGHVAFYYDVP